MLLCFFMKTPSGSRPDKTRTYTYANINGIVLFFQLSTYHVRTAWEISYLRSYLLLVPYDLFKPKIFKTVVIICSIIMCKSSMSWHEI
jgi:hypothetical protein